MRIAIVQPRTSYHIAGSEKVSLKHAEFLAKLGHTVDLYTSTSKKIKESSLFKEFVDRKLLGINILRFDISRLIPNLYDEKPDREHKRWIKESMAFDREIYSNLEKSKPDIILSYYLPDSIFKPPDIPNVLYISGYPTYPIPWYKLLMRSCDATISISSTVSEKWKAELQEVKLNYVLGTGVDYPINIKSQIVPRAKCNLVYAGRLIERKGILTLLDAFKKITETNKDIHLWVLGKGELEATLQKKISTLGLKKKVTLTGLVTNPYDYFAMADICVFPSHRGDGLMGTVLESMAVGKPVITTTDNGNEDVIANGKNGILIKPEDREVLVSAIENLIKDKTKRKILGEQAQQFIAKNITWERNIERLSEIFVDIVNKTR